MILSNLINGTGAGPNARFGRHISFAIALGLLVVSLAPTAVDAQRRSRGRRANRPAPAEETPPPISEETLARLRSGDSEQVQEALMELVPLGTEEVVRLIDARIRAGVPADALLPATESLALLGHPAAGPVLTQVLLTHRRPAVRVAAIQALVACQPPGAATAVRGRLGDPSPDVRSAAAIALGELGDAAAVPDLFRALDRQVNDAAGALAVLVEGETLEQFMGYLGRISFDVMGPALQRTIERTNLDEGTKLEIIARVQDLGTGEARVFLETLAESLTPNGPDQRVRQAAQDAALRVVD